MIRTTAMQLWEFIYSFIALILGSSGLWAWIASIRNNNSSEKKIMKGLAFHMIMQQGAYYLNRGSISDIEYNDLHDLLYVPYQDIGGNGAAKRLMEKVSELPQRRESTYETTDYE